MSGFAARLLPYALAFTSSLCIMILELVSSRLVAPQVGQSLTVWTSVIGIILAGICLGNVLGGRLADRVEPRRAIGPLFALGSLLTLCSLWVNAKVGLIIPNPDQMNWELRTVLVVVLDFLVPATVLGMVGPVVAKMAVEQARRAGSAIGDVYFLGAIGSIAGTFLCGFILMPVAPNSTIVILVAAALALLGGTLIGRPAGLAAGVLASLCLGLGSISPVVSRLGLGAIDLGSYQLNYLVLAGNAAAVVLGIVGFVELLRARRADDAIVAATAMTVAGKPDAELPRPRLTDLAILAFVASLGFMALEMVAGRLVQRHLGSSIYGWTCVIGVLLAGLSFGNFLGGKIADFVKNEKQASWLFLAASILTLSILLLETQPKWFAEMALGGEGKSFLSQAITLSKLNLGGGYSGYDLQLLDGLNDVKSLPTTGKDLMIVADVNDVLYFRIFDNAHMLVDTNENKLTEKAQQIVSLRRTLEILWPPHGLTESEKTSVSAAVSSVVGPRYSVPMSWPYRILFVVTLVFFLPALSLGTVSPVVAKLAVDRLKSYKRTGTAIGQVYAWGMVGSIIGTFLTGFFLIDMFGTKGVILLLGTTMAFGATLLGSVWHAIWAGVPLGLCVLAFTPPSFVDAIGKVVPFIKGPAFEGIGTRWGIREKLGDGEDAASKFTWIDESNYYYIKVENQLEDQGETQKRTLVLDNLIHGYFILDHPERLDYDYEHIYALVAYRAAKASGNVKFKETTEAVKPAQATEPVKPAKASEPVKPAPATEPVVPKPAGGLKSVQAAGEGPKAKADQFPKNPIADPPAGVNDMAEEEPGKSVPDVEHSSMKTLFLGGGAYCFQRHMQYAYPGTGVDVAEIDTHVTEANFQATGLPRDTPIKTYWGDARQFVELNQDNKQYDLVFGDAFNDFSVPWHLTTREFNNKIKKMLTPNGVYMINIIDVYETDEHALEAAEKKIDEDKIEGDAEQKKVRDRFLARARTYGGFVGAWTETAKLTFPNVYIFGTDSVPGLGLRETFVVVASMKALDLKDLGSRLNDPKFYTKGKRTEPKPYGPEDEKVVTKRSRGIILSDDFAPVENLLGPVAETRGDED